MFMICKIALFFLMLTTLVANESEHPPLLDNTKEAIAKYKRDSSESNKKALYDAMDKNYDAVVRQKQEKLQDRIVNRDKNIQRWLKSVESGKNPPFLNLQTANNKGNERREVSQAIDVYRKNPNSQSQKRLKRSLENYYDAFLQEQKEHIEDTIESKKDRLQASMQRFTSERFQPSLSRTNHKKEEMLAEMIFAFISSGASNAPVNPESRVRERTFNQAINQAQKNYLENPTTKNQEALKSEVAKAYNSAYEVCLKSSLQAKRRGLDGADELFGLILDEKFRGDVVEELTRQRNLYGRIDRAIRLGSSDLTNFKPRFAVESKELLGQIDEYEKSPNSKNLNLLKVKFNALYEKAMLEQESHMVAINSNLNALIEKSMQELTR